MWLFISAFFAFMILNLAVNVNHLQVVEYIPSPDITGTTLGNVILAAVLGFTNAIYTLTFIAIVVILFEYTLSFTYVCYCYDNRSWAVPALIRNAFAKITTHYSNLRDEEAKNARKDRFAMDAEILKIRNGNTEKIE